MLSTLFVKPTAEAIDDALGAAEREGAFLILDQPRVARVLAERGRATIAASARPRARRRGGTELACGDATLPIADAALAGVVGFNLGQRGDWRARLAEWTRATGDGGVIVLVDRAAATDLTRRALTSGLSEIEQRHAGRTLVTSGLVTHF